MQKCCKIEDGYLLACDIATDRMPKANLCATV